MVNILIAFYSRTGTIESLANAIADGAREAGGEVRLRRARELVSAETMAAVPGWTDSANRMNAAYEAPTPADAEWAEAIIFGTPTRYGNMASQMKQFIDQTGGLWMKGALVGKVGSVFTSTASQHGGQETTLTSFHTVLFHHGMVVVGLPYSFQGQGGVEAVKGGTPYGASTIADGDGSRQPSAVELEAPASRAATSPGSPPSWPEDFSQEKRLGLLRA